MSIDKLLQGSSDLKNEYSVLEKSILDSDLEIIEAWLTNNPRFFGHNIETNSKNLKRFREAIFRLYKTKNKT